MAKKHRSIGYYLDRCRTREEQVSLAREWNDRTREMHIEIVDELKHAIDNNNLDQLRMLFAELRTLTMQNHEALDRMFIRLTSPLKKTPKADP